LIISLHERRLPQQSPLKSLQLASARGCDLS
jgi:hypothetical protein